MNKKIITELFLAESEAIRALAGRIEESILSAAELCLACDGRIIVVGLGKSGLIGRKISATLASTGTSSFFVHAAEAMHGDLGTITEHDCALMISKSGSTPEVVSLLPPLKRMGVGIISITAEPASILGRASDVVLEIGVTEEAEPTGMIPTTSTAVTLAIGDALAVALMFRRGFTREDFAVFHPAGSIGHRLRRICEVMHTGAAIPVVPRSATVLDGIVAMSSGRLGHVIIAEEGKIFGIFSDGDLRRSLQAHPHEDIVGMKLLELCTCDPVVIYPDTLVEKAVRLMETNKITALPVVEDGQLIGLVHLHDLLENKVV